MILCISTLSVETFPVSLLILLISVSPPTFFLMSVTSYDPL